MRLSDIPTKLSKVWAAAATAATLRAIPVNSQIGISDGAASLTDGFPPLNAVRRDAGGVPPDIKDFNGILQALSAWIVWLQNGGAIRFDPGYVAANGGYPAGSILQSSVTLGRQFVSTADNNTTDPDSGAAANWSALGLGVASAADIAVGTRNDAAVTPLALEGYASPDFSINGSIRLPGGLIVKWGSAPGRHDEGVVNFPFAVPFPNACLKVIPTAVNTAGANRMDVWAQVCVFNAAGVSVYVQGTGISGTLQYCDGVDYIAVGF